MAGRVIQGFFAGQGAASFAPARVAPVQAKSAAAPHRPGPPPLAHARGAVQRAPAVQRHGGGDGFEVDPVRLGLAQGGGSPLPGALLAKMESAFGADFSAVRVHVGPQAARIGAIAFTTGNDLYFAPGRYQPESVQGQQLIGHELAHVIQQRQGRVRAPASGIAVVHDRALEAEADRIGLRASMHRAPLQLKRRAGPPSRQPGQRAIQRYTVLGQDKIFNAMPASRPWFGYPYAVVPAGAHFSAQRIQGGGAGANEFLDAGNVNLANVWRRNHNNLRLRVSNDHRMAIEDSNLTQRQPKAFWATAGVIAAANGARNPNSNTQLVQGGTSITILTGWHTQQTLYRVTPNFAAQPAQNCDELAGQVTGIGDGFRMQGRAGIMSDAIAHLLDQDPNRFDMTANPGDYVNWAWWRPGRVRELGLNEAARPDVGQAFAIGTVGRPIGFVGNAAQVLDIASGQVRNLSWAFHFAAVVARSGTDRVTLENYARGDNRRAGFDPRWYFQMYGEGSGQSFHEFHAAREEYANPATISTEQRNLPQMGWRWNPFN